MVYQGVKNSHEITIQFMFPAPTTLTMSFFALLSCTRGRHRKESLKVDFYKLLVRYNIESAGFCFKIISLVSLLIKQPAAFYGRDILSSIRRPSALDSFYTSILLAIFLITYICRTVCVCARAQRERYTDTAGHNRKTAPSGSGSR